MTNPAFEGLSSYTTPGDTTCPVSVSPSQRKPWRGFFVSSGDPFACASAGALPIERAI